MHVESMSDGAFGVQIVTDDGERVTIALRGECDLAAAPELRQVLEPASRAGAVLLDLSELTFLDCSALTVLLDAARHRAQVGDRLVLRDVQPPVERLLTLAAVTEQVEIARSEAGT